MKMKTVKKMWVALAILIALSPLGLLLPGHFKAGAAWGEWSTSEIKGLVGYIPRSLEKLSVLWSAPIPDYAFRGWEEKGLPHRSFAYILSAAIGIAISAAVIFVIGKLLTRKEDR